MSKNNTKIADGVFKFQTKGSKAPFIGKSLRMGYDIVTPGRIAADITVQLNKTKGEILFTAKANPRPPFDLDGMVDKFGYNKVKEDIVLTLPVDLTKYDADSCIVSTYNGITRVFFVVAEASALLTMVDGHWVIQAQDEIVDVDVFGLDD